MVRLVVDGMQILGDESKSLLDVCLDHGIYIPNLCSLREMENPPASCRLCFVEIEGERRPVVSCRVKPRDGMIVRTDTEPVRRLQRTSLRLLLSVHDATCRSCPSNKNCELQKMVRFLGVRLRPRRFDHIDREPKSTTDHPFLDLVHSRCVLCGKCIYACRKRNGYSLLTFARRGFDTVIGSFGEDSSMMLACSECLECARICPVSAILPKPGNSALPLKISLKKLNRQYDIDD